MPFPAPTIGLVVRYSYLWRDDHLKGREEGSKDRPCAVIILTHNEDGAQVVSVLPITHTPPRNADDAVEIPAVIKRRLKLDEEPSWVVITEANRFIWPGPDLRPFRQDGLSSVAIGHLPATFYNYVRDKFVAKLEARKARFVLRTE